MPEYVVLGGAFRVKGGWSAGDYFGRIVVSKDTFYLIITTTPAEFTASAAGGLGLVGGLLAAAQAAVSDDTIRGAVVKMSELPEEVTHHPDWPAKWRGDYSVVVIPRGAVKRLRYSWWRTFDILTHDQTYYVSPRDFGRRRVLRQLREWGWEC
jgi:hypothetical protein